MNHTYTTGIKARRPRNKRKKEQSPMEVGGFVIRDNSFQPPDDDSKLMEKIYRNAKYHDS